MNEKKSDLKILQEALTDREATLVAAYQPNP